MIRIGSQVDVVVPWRDDMLVRVQPGDRVRAGQTVLID
jgi:phosphatidylserine decarboxylase